MGRPKGSINRSEEEKRISKLLKKAKQRPHLRESLDKSRKCKSMSIYLNSPNHQLMYTPAVMGDIVRMVTKNRAEAVARRDPGRVLVKDGKLTEEGVKAGIKL